MINHVKCPELAALRLPAGTGHADLTKLLCTYERNTLNASELITHFVEHTSSK